MNNDIEVSICCITYNQEKYIKEALDSFLSQKTEFSYEIVIHDDASTDNTVKILKQYKKRYPDKIVLILEKENQYSKRPNSVLEIVFNKARGKYIALCEGDDGFCDDEKLSMQYKYIKTHNYSFCSHNTKIVDDDSNLVGKIEPYDKEIITINDFLNIRQSMHTSSMFFAKKDVLNLPKFFKESVVGDLPLKLYFLSRGNCYHINKECSFYRENTKNSWSFKQKNSRNIKYKNFQSEINTYLEFNKFTNYKYNKEINDRIIKIEFNYFKDENNLKKIKEKKYRNLYIKLNMKEKIKLYIKQTIIYKIYYKIKYKE